MKNIVELFDVVEDIFEDERIYFPVVYINEKQHGCWCITSENSSADFAGAIEELRDALVSWAQFDDSNSLLFCACGDDIQAKQKLEKYLEEKYEIYVF